MTRSSNVQRLADTVVEMKVKAKAMLTWMRQEEWPLGEDGRDSRAPAWILLIHSDLEESKGENCCCVSVVRVSALADFCSCSLVIVEDAVRQRPSASARN